MEHRHLIYLILISALTVVSCSKQTDKDESAYNSIAEYLKEKNYSKSISDINKIVVITDNGCSTCNKGICNLSYENYIDDDSTLIIITSKGQNFNVLAFKDKPNVIFDWSSDIMPLFNSTSVFYIENNDIDTILSINAGEYINQMQYISKKESKE